MAFKPQDLSVIAYANGFTLWHYSTLDIANDVDTSGYFNEASNMLRVGDVLFANTNTGDALSTGILHVASNVANIVDVTNMTNIGSSNTD